MAIALSLPENEQEQNVGRKKELKEREKKN